MFESGTQEGDTFWGHNMGTLYQACKMGHVFLDVILRTLELQKGDGASLWENMTDTFHASTQAIK